MWLTILALAVVVIATQRDVDCGELKTVREIVFHSRLIQSQL